MNPRSLRSLASIAIVASAIACSKPEAGAPVASADADAVAATVADKTITVGEIDEAIRSDLARVEMQRYEARREHLDRVIDQTLVGKTAAEVGVSDEDLFKKEVADKVKPASDDEVKAYYEQNKAQIGKPFEEIAPRIRQALASQTMQARQREFVAGLRKEYGVTIALAPPRTEVSTEGGQSQGPADAPIVLVEFSDYQCPFCARTQEIVDRVLKKYGDKIQHVFMDFPIEQIHPRAKPASIAGRCAAEQGKFWEFHKQLFHNQRELTDENFKKWAGDLKLDVAKFESCRTSGSHEAAIAKTLEAGQDVGVSGTPAFFVNGVMISGA
ncbi:MAG: DsbA family protein, partial [Candidatus Binatia bacterium]